MKARDIAKATNKTVNRRGRPPRAGVERYRDGSIVRAERGESEEQILATVMAYRRKLGLLEGQLRDQRAGTVLGRIALAQEISCTQYEAGLRFARTVARYHVQEGIPRPWPVPIDLTGAPWGRGGRPEPELDEVERIRGEYADMLSRLHDLEHAATYRGTSRLLRRVILLDEQPGRGEIGNLRAGLNVLARLWGMRP